jgi:phage tail-like protein
MADQPNDIGQSSGAPQAPGAGGGGPAPAGGAVATKRRESALEKLKRQLAEHSADMPPLEGYDLRKAMKILRTGGFPLDKVRVRYIDSEEPRGLVVRQYPDAGEKIDLKNELYQIELCVSDSNCVEYLPSIYQRSDITGRNFLRDFLWIFQHIFNQTREKLDNIHTYFDPLETPADFLPWLGSWVAMVLDEDWPEIKKRNLIRKAVELYHLRGTVRGLKVYLKIFTGVEPKIIENYWPFEGIQVSPFSMDPEVLDEKGKPIEPSRPDYDELKKAAARPDWKGATIGEDMIELPYVDKAHVFTIELPMQQEQIELDMIKKIHRILDREKPAHTDYYVIFQPEPEKEEDFAIEVGIRSTIGVDTWTGD